MRKCSVRHNQYAIILLKLYSFYSLYRFTYSLCTYTTSTKVIIIGYSIIKNCCLFNRRVTNFNELYFRKIKKELRKNKLCSKTNIFFTSFKKNPGNFSNTMNVQTIKNNQ